MLATMTFALVRERFRTIARVIVPEAEALDEAGWAELERIVEKGLASQSPSVRRQLGLLVRALDSARLSKTHRGKRRMLSTVGGMSMVFSNRNSRTFAC